MLRVLLVSAPTMNASTIERFPIGRAVKPSGYALEKARLYWLGLGHEPAKTRAKEAYEREAAKRGTVTAHTPSKFSGASIEITWSNGAKSQCLDYMVEPAE